MATRVKVKSTIRKSVCRQPLPLTLIPSLTPSFSLFFKQVPTKYNFHYIVNNEKGNDYGHQESRDGDLTKGSYYVVLPDARKQTVEYVVDGKSGFLAEVTYDGKAKYPDQTLRRIYKLDSSEESDESYSNSKEDSSEERGQIYRPIAVYRPPVISRPRPTPKPQPPKPQPPKPKPTPKPEPLRPKTTPRPQPPKPKTTPRPEPPKPKTTTKPEPPKPTPSPILKPNKGGLRTYHPPAPRG